MPKDTKDKRLPRYGGGNRLVRRNANEGARVSVAQVERIATQVVKKAMEKAKTSVKKK